MIGVPSKGRAGKSVTLAALRDHGDEVWVVCPGDEIDVYRRAYPWITRIMEQSTPGIGTARQQLLTSARRNATGPFWMLDDDIEGTFERTGDGKLARTTLGALLYHMEVELLEMGTLTEGVGHIALAGPNFRHRAWVGPDREWDKHLRNFVWVNTEAPIDYWPHLKEDLDVVLQALTSGWHTYRWNVYAFDSPRMGTSQGGCRDDYDSGKLDEACHALVEKWPDVVSLKLDTDTGHLTNRVDWRALRRMVPA